MADGRVSSEYFHEGMFYDLNIPWRTPDDELRRTVELLDHRKLSFPFL